MLSATFPFLSRSSLFLFCFIAIPSAAMAGVASYKGTMEVVKTSGAICGSHDRKIYPIEAVLNSGGSGIDGYFHDKDVSTGHFKGRDLGHLQVFYPSDNPQLAGGNSLSLESDPKGLFGELREKGLAPTDENCAFDSALVTLEREPARDSEKAWQECAALWQIELLNRRTFDFITAGKYAEAEKAAKRSLELSDRHFGGESDTSSVPLSNLAVIYRRLGRYQEAEPLCKRVLATAEKTLGSEHPTVGIRLINLAELYEATGRNSQAEPLYQRALTIYVKAFGPEHPDVAKVLNNLAVLYEAQGRYQEAEPLYQRALKIMTKAFGPDHPSVATLRRNLDQLHRKHPSNRSFT